ncbi:hypothetical protein CBR_g44931 [Chara braunii]|uniref:Chromo domain-containing protein n=1 Tax=Chara braunii TaxID=69332 RepID=A0A388LY11_CHABU|nr:hypothetical protein CBR_g44931 [Chara braunii]|eukprot:GBG87196.1 hypothetical protein CBR_g44931 [Chara braunii]
MAQLRDYLHTAVPAPLMDVGADVVDLHAFIAKIDREFKTQRYNDIDAPLLYIHIQIGKATCSALIDCGASRNYISQDFMVRAGLGPRVRRKSQPTQVTLADGHTHKSIDRCIDAVSVYFAPHASVLGPWSVTAAAGDEPDGPSFVINIPEHLTVHPVFHASKLATYTPAKSDDFPDRRSQDPPSMDGHQEVDRVISDRKYGSKPRQYKVTFNACDRDDTRWISGADLKASAPLIYAHYEKRRLAQEASRPAPPTRTVVPPSDRQLRPRRQARFFKEGGVWHTTYLHGPYRARPGHSA